MSLFVRPDSACRSRTGIASAGIHRLDIRMPHPTGDKGVQAENLLGPAAGRLEYCMQAIPHGSRVIPNHLTPSVEFDNAVSQRFALQQCRFSFGSGDTFECFGSGRTFPMILGGRPQLAAAGLAEIKSGTGAFQRLEGNLTFCGVLTEEYGFRGHVIVRLVDQYEILRVARLQADPGEVRPLDQGLTWLQFVGRKGEQPDQKNRISARSDRTPRGVNISTMLSQVSTGFSADRRLRVSDPQFGDVIGKEIGFGPLPSPTTPPGVPLRPFPFEGVARYRFHDRSGKSVGAITTNITEGRRIDLEFQHAPNRVGYRFGFFGPILSGTGCFDGVQGLFYGASASFLDPPPGEHVVTHLYAAMLGDRDARYRI